MTEAIIDLIKIAAIIAFVLWFFGYMQSAFMQHAAENLSFELRNRYLKALMKQETEYFERQKGGVQALPS